MRDMFATTQFGKDLEREYKARANAAKNPAFPTELALVIGRLLFDVPLEPRHKDHALTGPWKGYRDWLSPSAGSCELGRAGSPYRRAPAAAAPWPGAGRCRPRGWP